MYSTIYELILFLLTVFTVIVQFYAIFLIQFQSQQTMKEYVFFLNLFSIWDSIFTITIGFIIAPYPITPLMGSAARGLIAYFGTQVCMITGSILIGIGSCLLLIQDYCLLYRFSIIQQGNVFHNFLMRPYMKALALIIIHLLGCLTAALFYFMLFQPEDIPAFLSNQPPSVTETLLPDEKIIMVDLHKPLTKPALIALIVCVALSEIYCVIVAFVVLFILIRKSVHFSKETYRLHLQFSSLLAAQFVTPLLFIIVPVIYYLIFVIILGGQSKREITQLTFACLTVYGATNSLLTISFVGVYRKYTYNKFIEPVWRRIKKILPNHTEVTNIQNTQGCVTVSNLRGLEIAARTNLEI